VNEGAYVFVTGPRETELTAAKKQIGKNVSAIQGDVIVGGIERRARDRSRFWIQQFRQLILQQIADTVDADVRWRIAG
jgi:hypothetical protein